MQKLVKRVTQAEKQALRRKTLSKARVDRQEEKNTLSAFQKGAVEVQHSLRRARQRRQELWEMGPLAPKRNWDFLHEGSAESYGRIDPGATPRIWDKKLIQQRCAWAGGPERLCLAPGDRVVILQGIDKGKVDTIRQIFKDSGFVTLMNHQKLFVDPEGKESMGQGRVEDAPIPIDGIRLVHPIADPATGVAKDAMINELKPTTPNMRSPNMTFDRWEYGIKYDRIVPGHNITIPWPKTEAPQLETHEVDTTRAYVENRTFFWKLFSPPMPPTVIDELRHKNSRFRTRHEASYVQKILAEEAKKKNGHKLLLQMQTPLEELHEKRRATRAAAGEPELSEEMLTKIGEMVARSKADALEKAGLEEVGNVSEDASTGQAPPSPPRTTQ